VEEEVAPNLGKPSWSMQVCRPVPPTIACYGEYRGGPVTPPHIVVLGPVVDPTIAPPQAPAPGPIEERATATSPMSVAGCQGLRSRRPIPATVPSQGKSSKHENNFLMREISSFMLTYRLVFSTKHRAHMSSFTTTKAVKRGTKASSGALSRPYSAQETTQ
jgi:hypothetical protein